METAYSSGVILPQSPQPAVHRSTAKVVLRRVGAESNRPSVVQVHAGSRRRAQLFSEPVGQEPASRSRLVTLRIGQCPFVKSPSFRLLRDILGKRCDQARVSVTILRVASLSCVTIPATAPRRV